MDASLVFMVFLLQGLQEAEAFVVNGEEGQDITIKCDHSNAFSNMKYFCIRYCEDKDILVTSKKEDTNGKYKIKDTGNTFYVTVSKLTLSDSGTYWCGIDRVGVDTYHEVVIQVTRRVIDQSDSQAKSLNALTSKTLLYIGTGLGVVVLALAIVLLIFFRQRKKRISLSHEKGHGLVNAAPSKQKQDRHQDDIESSDSKKQEARSSTNNATDNIYCNVATQPGTQQEALFYSTVSFNKHEDCSTVTPPASQTTYTSIELRSTDSTVYSDV